MMYSDYIFEKSYGRLLYLTLIFKFYDLLGKSIFVIVNDNQMKQIPNFYMSSWTLNATDHNSTNINTKFLYIQLDIK